MGLHSDHAQPFIMPLACMIGQSLFNSHQFFFSKDEAAFGKCFKIGVWYLIAQFLKVFSRQLCLEQSTCLPHVQILLLGTLFPPQEGTSIDGPGVSLLASILLSHSLCRSYSLLSHSLTHSLTHSLSLSLSCSTNLSRVQPRSLI